MEYCALLKCRSDGAMQAVFQEEFAFPFHDMREQVAVERGVLGEQRVKIQLATGRHQLVEPHLTW
jgi:hypothetical protein